MSTFVSIMQPRSDAQGHVGCINMMDGPPNSQPTPGSVDPSESANTEAPPRDAQEGIGTEAMVCATGAGGGESCSRTTLHITSQQADPNLVGKMDNEGGEQELSQISIDMELGVSALPSDVDNDSEAPPGDQGGHFWHSRS